MTHVVLGDMNPIAPKYPITEISSKYLELAEKFNDLTDRLNQSVSGMTFIFQNHSIMNPNV